MLSITLRKRWCIMKLFHPVVQGRRANTCRHSMQILTCRLFDSCHKEGNFGSSQTSHICRHSFHFQMQWNMQALISLSDAILKEQTHHARVSLQSDFKLGLRVPASSASCRLRNDCVICVNPAITHKGITA